MHTYCFKILFLSERVASVVDLLNFVLILCPMIILIMRRTTMPHNFLSLIVVWNLWFIANAFPFVFFGVQSWKTIRYVHEQGIMKYIKIAASLPTKTVRDVAMRCQWVGVSSLLWSLQMFVQCYCLYQKSNFFSFLIIRMLSAKVCNARASRQLLCMNTEYMQPVQNVH